MVYDSEGQVDHASDPHYGGNSTAASARRILF